MENKISAEERFKTARGSRVLDLGCGRRNKKEGSVGLDIRPAEGVDVVHDLDMYPWPFETGSFDFIEMSHIIEHIDKPLDMMNEVHRISADGAIVRIITPHYTSCLSYGDMEHKHHFGYNTFLTLQDTGLFAVAKHRLYFSENIFYRVFWVNLLANLFPKRWEKHFAFIFPARDVEVFLEVKKPDNVSKPKENYIY